MSVALNSQLKNILKDLVAKPDGPSLVPRLTCYKERINFYKSLDLSTQAVTLTSTPPSSPKYILTIKNFKHQHQYKTFEMNEISALSFYLAYFSSLS